MTVDELLTDEARFSALQRAENSSAVACADARRPRRRFSALQRAENSSAKRQPARRLRCSVSVLFSEPKIPQRPTDAERSRFEQVSVLFSEPKIPQRSTA